MLTRPYDLPVSGTRSRLQLLATLVSQDGQGSSHSFIRDPSFPDSRTFDETERPALECSFLRWNQHARHVQPHLTRTSLANCPCQLRISHKRSPSCFLSSSRETHRRYFRYCRPQRLRVRGPWRFASCPKANIFDHHGLIRDLLTPTG